MRTMHAVLASTRPKFLILTPLCVLLGYAAIRAAGYNTDTGLLALVLIAALCAHVAVNTLNEYQDFTSGLDSITNRTPFSGGSGALPAQPEAASAVLLASGFSLAIAIAIGLYLVALRGLPLLAFGLLGVAIILTYTRWLNRQAWLCLIAPGTGFGLLMVPGSALALSGQMSASALWLSLPAFFLVNGLLLLNQFPDLEADRRVGRRHLLIRYGPTIGAPIYGLMLLLAYLAIIVPVAAGTLPPGALAGLATALIAVPAYRGVRRHTNNPELYTEQLQPYLGMNAIITLLTLALIAVGVLLTLE